MVFRVLFGFGDRADNFPYLCTQTDLNLHEKDNQYFDIIGSHEFWIVCRTRPQRSLCKQ